MLADPEEIPSKLSMGTNGEDCTEPVGIYLMRVMIN
jgi:hypothetical protein